MYGLARLGSCSWSFFAEGKFPLKPSFFNLLLFSWGRVNRLFSGDVKLSTLFRERRTLLNRNFSSFFFSLFSSLLYSDYWWWGGGEEWFGPGGTTTKRDDFSFWQFIHRVATEPRSKTPSTFTIHPRKSCVKKSGSQEGWSEKWGIFCEATFYFWKEREFFFFNGMIRSFGKRSTVFIYFSNLFTCWWQNISKSRTA